MSAIRQKLHSRRGSSVVLALFVMLVAVMISTVVLRTATTNAGRVSSGKAEEQAYLTVSSAAGLLRDEVGELSFSWNDVEEPGVLHEGAGSYLTPLVRELVREVRGGSTRASRSFTVETENMDAVSVTLTLTDGWALRGELELANGSVEVNNCLTLRAWGTAQMDADGTTTLSFPRATVAKGGN